MRGGADNSNKPVKDRTPTRAGWPQSGRCKHLNGHVQMWGRAANNCTTCFGGFKHKTEIILITRDRTSGNSSDLSLGRRPTSKSVEISEVRTLGTELQTCEKVDFSQKWWQLLAARPLNADKCPCEAEAGDRCARCMDAGTRIRSGSLNACGTVISARHKS